MKGVSPYSVVIGIFLFTLAAAAGTIGYLYLSSFKIASSPLIKNEASLRQYLGAAETFPKQIKGIRRLSFTAQNTFRKTDDCISDKDQADPIFCFDETWQNGALNINIYPNTDFYRKHSETIDRLLNFSLLTILETRLGINSDKKNLYVDNGEENFIFKW